MPPTSGSAAEDLPIHHPRNDERHTPRAIGEPADPLKPGVRPTYLLLCAAMIGTAVALCGGFISVRLLPEQLWVADAAFTLALILALLATVPLLVLGRALYASHSTDRRTAFSQSAQRRGPAAAEAAENAGIPEAPVGPIAESVSPTEEPLPLSLLQTVLDQIPYPIVALDEQGQAQFVNEALKRLRSTATGQLTQRKPDGKISHFDAQELPHGNAEDGEEWLTQIDGKEHRYQLQRVPLSGLAEGELLIGVEVTELHRVQHQLQFSQRLEILGTLAGGIAHDFNNLLTPIIGYASILKEASLKPEHQSKVDAIAHAAERARQVAQQMLSFSRQSDAPIVHELINLEDLLNEAITFMRASVPPSVDIQVDIRGQCWVNADSGELHQVMVNLCTNAAQSIHQPSGAVLVTCESLPRGSDLLPAQLRDMDCARIQVVDDGRGMSPAVLNHIFEPFFTTKDAGEGSGLGLSVVRSIVNRHGGIVDVQSSIGMGSCFSVYLPGATGGAVSAPPPQERRRLLLVDDDSMVLRVLEDLLKTKGYTVTAFNDPRLALDFINQAPELIDVMITDNSMPKLRGVELARAARQAKPGVPVILITGFARPTKGELAHVSRTLSKPVSARDLTEAIRAVTTTTVAA